MTARIFIVEDNPEVARLLNTVLRDFGFDTDICRNAAELRQRLRVGKPDLCIIDLGLPDADGMDLVQEIQRRHDCGLLILTGRAYLGDRVMGLELGADDYVTKPFEPRELVARVRSILRRRGGAGPLPHDEHRPAEAHFSGWVFHPDTNTLRGSDQQEWTLSSGEAKLLCTFLQRPNRILAREQICGDPDLSPLDRSIDVRISRLRRKLEVDAQNPKLIRTVYGAGYLFASEVTWA
ncbi:response regulator transcription factor [Sphaerotilus sp.]|uniref:response regulator transcription factor n=1 Tax=Sphaerotilus sp. TaxID=2093942 RepID=UPI002ACD5BCF|nr:response regulator transcription factor [Sphaerotilus sp.]MDZ7856196.1 response regulator transcription factor [Sphaerotilus sp.]